MLTELIRNGLNGVRAHVGLEGALEDLDWHRASQCPTGSPHTIYQIVNHMTFWQEWWLAQLRGENPPAPTHAAESWPGGIAPATRAEWAQSVDRFLAGLRAALAEAGDAPEAPNPVRPQLSRAETLRALASHNSYHLGQIVLLRRMLGAWPPPGGGETW